MLRDVTCPGSTIDCDAVPDADCDESSMLADSDVSDPVKGTFLFVGCCCACCDPVLDRLWVHNRDRSKGTLNFSKLDQLGTEFVDAEMALVSSAMTAMETSDSSGLATHPLASHQEHHVSHLRHARSEQLKVNVDEAGCEDQGKSSESGDAEETCAKVTSDTSLCTTQGMASTATTPGLTWSRAWNSASGEVWVTLASLLRHLTPHWVCYSVHLSRTERYCLLVTAVMTSGFWQSLVFVRCQHESSPVACQCSGCFTDWDRLTHSLGGTAILHQHHQDLQALQQALRAWFSHTSRKEEHPAQMGDVWAIWLDTGGSGASSLRSIGLAHDPVLRVRRYLDVVSGVCALSGDHDDVISNCARPQLHPLRFEPFCCARTENVVI